MSTWYSAATPAEQARLVDAWRDAPIENVEVLGFILEAARDQVVAYAPAQIIPPETGHYEPGPDTVTRRNRFPNPDVTTLTGFSENTGQNVLTHTGTAVRFTMSTTAAIGVSVGGYGPAIGEQVRYLVRARANRALVVRQRIRGTLGPLITITTDWQWFDRSGPAGGGAGNQSGFIIAAGAAAVGDWLEIDRVLITSPIDAGTYFSGNTPDTIVDGRTYAYGWEGAENASVSVESYRPDVFIPDPPEIASRLVYAQLQQAKNLLVAGSVARGGEYGDGEFTYEPRPLDKAIKNLIRPIDGKLNVL